jgi:hypothetical protein
MTGAGKYQQWKQQQAGLPERREASCHHGSGLFQHCPFKESNNFSTLQQILNPVKSEAINLIFNLARNKPIFLQPQDRHI